MLPDTSWNIHYIVPHPHILQALKLSIPNHRNTGLWLLPDGNVFLRKLEGRGSPLLLDSEYFDRWCQSEGLDYTWVYIGERTSWTGQSRANGRRTLGAAWFEEGKVRSFTNVPSAEDGTDHKETAGR